MSEGYESVTDNILPSFISAIETASSFDSSNVSYAYRKRITEYPYCRVRIMRDRLTALGPMETRHDVDFEVQIHHRGRGEESDQDKIIGYVGEIVDILEADRKVGTALSDVSARINSIEYSFRGGDRDTVFYYAYLDVTIKHLRNV